MATTISSVGDISRRPSAGIALSEGRGGSAVFAAVATCHRLDCAPSTPPRSVLTCSAAFCASAAASAALAPELIILASACGTTNCPATAPASAP